MEVSSQLHAVTALQQGKEQQTLPLNRRIGLPQSQSGRVGEDKYLLSWLIQPGEFWFLLLGGNAEVIHNLIRIITSLGDKELRESGSH
jgi:hypothetical protein